MESSLGGWSIVIVGNWNRMIFRPEWIGRGRLTDAQDIMVELPINNPTLPPRFLFDDITLRVTFGNLTISPQNEDPATLNRIQDVAIKILQALPHTPVSGIGINFEFIEREPLPFILNMFNISDLSRLSDGNYIVNATNITRKLTINEDILNLRHQLDENTHVLIGFNFHKDIANAEEGLAFLQMGVIQKLDRAKQLMENIYELTD